VHAAKLFNGLICQSKLSIGQQLEVVAVAHPLVFYFLFFGGTCFVVIISGTGL
jgi:hypothetical protein